MQPDFPRGCMTRLPHLQPTQSPTLFFKLKCQPRFRPGKERSRTERERRCNKGEVMSWSAGFPAGGAVVTMETKAQDCCPGCWKGHQGTKWSPCSPDTDSPRGQPLPRDSEHAADRSYQNKLQQTVGDVLVQVVR